MVARNSAVREHGLALTSRIKRWLLTGAVAPAAFLSLVAAHSSPRPTVNATSGAAATSGATSRSQTSPAGTGGGLEQPAPPPAAAVPSSAVSGGW